MNIAKLLLTFPYYLRTLTKAKAMTKKIFQDADLVSEETRYFWMQRRTKYVLWLLNIKVIPHNSTNWLDKSVLLVANHQSNLDPVALFALNNFAKTAPLAFIAKKELLKMKYAANFLYLIDVIFLDRLKPRHMLEALEKANELIRIPRGIALFPEGTRSKTKAMQPFKAAFLNIAQKAHCPIVPVSIVNSYEFEQKPRPKTIYLHIVFHKPIKPINLVNRKREIISKQLQLTIQKGLDKYAHVSANEAKLMYAQYKKERKASKKEAK